MATGAQTVRSIANHSVIAATANNGLDVGDAADSVAQVDDHVIRQVCIAQGVVAATAINLSIDCAAWIEGKRIVLRIANEVLEMIPEPW